MVSSDLLHQPDVSGAAAERDLIGARRDPSRYVDLGFPAQGRTFPLDHGYALFSAVSALVPGFHDRRQAPVGDAASGEAPGFSQPTSGEGAGWGLHPILGTKTAPGVLTLERASMVKVRAPVDDIGAFMPLAGKALDLAGHKIRLGVPRVFPLVPAPALKARAVTIKGFTEPEPFAAALRRKLALLPELGQDPERVDVAVGSRRVMRVGVHTVVAFAVAVGGLEAQASIVIQAYGLGGRRHMGAGVFVPGPDRSEPHDRGRRVPS